MAFDIEVDYKIVMHRLHNSFSQRWYLFTLEFVPVEMENSSLERSQDTHVHTWAHTSPTTKSCFLGIPKHNLLIH